MVNFDWAEYFSTIGPLVAYSLSIAAYGLVVYLFYKKISHKLIFGEETIYGPRVVGGFKKGLMFFLVFPLFTFAYFILLSFSLVFLSEGASIEQVFLAAMAVILSVRVTAYISESASHDLAKILPLGLLGVFLLRLRLDGVENNLANLLAIKDHVFLIFSYFTVIVAIEFILRFGLLLTIWYKSKVFS